MRLFDLHCDTLYRAYTEKSSLFDDSFHISFDKTDGISPYIQCLAVWIPDEYRGDAAWELFCACALKLRSELEGTDITWCKSADDIRRTAENGGRGVILTVEGGAALGGKAGRLREMNDIGVRMMTLTWNGRNELGNGIGEADNGGLTQFGMEIVGQMEQLGMIVDVSHGSEQLFRDVASIASKPFVASHSNLRRITNHRRNLSDEQFEKIMSISGLAGLNFCADFLASGKYAEGIPGSTDGLMKKTPEDTTSSGAALHNSGVYDIMNHAGAFMALGGAGNLAIGADFDGADLPDDITGIESMPELWKSFAERFGKEMTDAVFFGNAYRFFTENLR